MGLFTATLFIKLASLEGFFVMVEKHDTNRVCPLLLETFYFINLTGRKKHFGNNTKNENDGHFGNFVQDKLNKLTASLHKFSDHFNKART